MYYLTMTKLPSKIQLLLVTLIYFSAIITCRWNSLTQYRTSHTMKDYVNEVKYKKQSYDEGAVNYVNQEKLVTVAYAISFIHCNVNDFMGLIDASLVLRHSIHKISSRNPASGSKYDYKMYAFVHRTQAITCVDNIEKLGFEVIVVDPPFEIENISNDFVRKKIHKTFCCGHHEFIKLHAFNLTEEIFVHLDIDFFLNKPMDHLFDAILYDKDSVEGKAARGKIQGELQFPNEHEIPDDIGAFFTRDWSLTPPHKGWKSGYQAGFMVGKPDPTIIADVSNVVLTHNYTSGYTYDSGWGNLGYGDFITGAMGMQGVMAYFYDEIRPNTTVELNMCLYNHLGMDSRFNQGGPWFNGGWGVTGQCRDSSEDSCDQCMSTPTDDIYSVHLTACGKSWNCDLENQIATSPHLDTEHCLELHKVWHELRSDLENEVFKMTGNETVKQLSAGELKRDVFMGHCQNEKEYISLHEFLDEIGELANNLYASTT